MDCLTCTKCAQTFPIYDGIPDFIVSGHSDFYELKGEQFHFPKIVPSRRLKTRIAIFFGDDDFSTTFSFLKRMMRKPGVILDAGCGGGNMFYASLGPTIGIDLAFSSLRRARVIYTSVARASLEALPLPDNAFDYVVSTDVLEHLAPTIKDQSLAEMMRVLKPCGRMVHVFPVDSHHPLMQWAKRFPQLYQKYFIDLDGHDGLETARDILERFRRLRLKIVQVSILKGFVWSKWEVIKRFDNEYRQTAKWLDRLVRMAKFLGRNRWINHGVNPVLWVLDRLLTAYFGLDHAYRVGVCLEKP
jgi:SAM-dependent methyltransferase